MIAQTAQHLHRLPTWVYLLLVTFMLSIGMIVIVSSASAQMSIGGRVMSYVLPPTAGPCTYGFGFTVGPPAPSKPPCVVWAMGLPPIGFSFLGTVMGPYVVIGGFGP